MRILLLSHSFNSLTQRLYVDLAEQGHLVSVEFDINDGVTAEAVELFRPDLVVAPFLKRLIPEAVWKRLPCLVVHPGPPGDRGPASLDWAILEGASEWGVTVLQATGELDGGPIWAWRCFPMRKAAKSSLYRNEVTEAAAAAVIEAVERFQSGRQCPQRADEPSALAPRWRPAMRRSDRAIDWASDDTDTVLRKIRAADGTPGVLDRVCDRNVYLHNATRADIAAAERLADASPGALIARSDTAVARATRDGAVWIGHLRLADGTATIKQPAADVLAGAIGHLPFVPGPRDVWYEEADGVGYLHFPLHNGAMGIGACRRLVAAFRQAAGRATSVIVLMGGADFWSNGLDLNAIEAAESPADESWANINAIDDLAEEIVRTTSHVVISALCGNAGAGGVFLARGADEVWIRRGVVLNPHYKDMGNLYGSELWTYLLAKHAGEASARRIMQSRLPMGAVEAVRLGLAERIVEGAALAFQDAVRSMARETARDPGIGQRIAGKQRRRAADEATRPLATYRAEELARMRRNFYGFDPSYHVARYNFVHKVAKSRTPLTIAHHRDKQREMRTDEKEAAQ